MSAIDQAFATSLESGNPYAIAATGALKVIDVVIPQIGAGRKEANQITPVQKQLGNLLDAINEEFPQAGIERLYQLRQTLDENWNRFKTWVQSQPWKDGRAAAQAIDETEDPYLTVARLRQNINARIVALGGSSATGGPQAAGGGDNTLLLAGGALVVAKVLGFL
jgi:hypothetical protein